MKTYNVTKIRGNPTEETWANLPKAMIDVVIVAKNFRLKIELWIICIQEDGAELAFLKTYSLPARNVTKIKKI